MMMPLSRWSVFAQELDLLSWLLLLLLSRLGGVESRDLTAFDLVIDASCRCQFNRFLLLLLLTGCLLLSEELLVLLRGGACLVGDE